MTYKEYCDKARSEGKARGISAAVVRESGLSARTVGKSAAGHWVAYPTAWDILRALRRLDPRFVFSMADADRMSAGEVIRRKSRRVRAFGRTESSDE